MVERTGEKEGEYGVCLGPRLLSRESRLLLSLGLLLCQLELRVVRGILGLGSKQPRLFQGDECTSCVDGERGRVDYLGVIPEMAVETLKLENEAEPLLRAAAFRGECQWLMFIAILVL